MAGRVSDNSSRGFCRILDLCENVVALFFFFPPQKKKGPSTMVQLCFVFKNSTEGTAGAYTVQSL